MNTTNMKISGNGWIADVWMTSTDTATNVTCNTWGDTKECALNGAKWVLDMFAKGRLAFIRTEPEANSEMDFDTKMTKHSGFTRFSFATEPGEWTQSDVSSLTVGLGNLELKTEA